jgi:hypothetical protein
MTNPKVVRLTLCPSHMWLTDAPCESHENETPIVRWGVKYPNYGLARRINGDFHLFRHSSSAYRFMRTH